MVYLKEILKQNRIRLLQLKNIEMAAYLFVASEEEINNYDFDLTPDEKIALKGYKREMVESSKIMSITSKPRVKGIDATSNIFKLCGLYLASKNDLIKTIQEKYNQSDFKQKYFLCKIEPSLYDRLTKEVIGNKTEDFSVIISRILNAKTIDEIEVDSALQSILNMELDVQAQILLEDLEKALLKIKYNNKSSEDLIRDVLINFSNAIQKILKERRKGHPEFKIEDEYDVQDILYVILKSFFPLLRDEDPIPKVGAKSTKIDLILREEKVLIEVKMLKEKDNNESEFIEQLKKDFESYHQCQWLKKLFCFVYDPYKKTRDLANFKDLDGDRAKNGHTFNVEVILTS
jgi:hypothetical protein